MAAGNATLGRAERLSQLVVVLLWDQGDFSVGTRLTGLVGLVDDSRTNADALALDIGMFLIDKPHGANGDRDDHGRYWLD